MRIHLGHLLLLLVFSGSLPLPKALQLCTDLRAPVMLNVTLKFCPNDGGGGSCCDAAEDDALQGQFKAMDVNPDGECARLLKSILCAKCNPFSAELFNTGSTTRTVPLMCSYSASAGSSSQSEDPSHPKEDYCEQDWKYCKSTAISNSPFRSSATASDKSTCFNGHGVSFNSRRPSPSPQGSLEKIGNASYLNMVAHPDGSSKAFFSRQDGKIWLASVPEQGMGDSLQLDETSPFLDLTAGGYLSSGLGLVGVAFHPDFVNNGRFFVT